MKFDKEGDFWEPAIWCARLYAPFVWVVAGAFVLCFIIVLLGGIKLPSKPIYVPHEWTCHSKYYGGYCERTGTNLGKPDATGTAKPQ
jgi:hypothetical protein